MKKIIKKAFRKLHLKITPILFIPLLATAVTGIIYGLGDSMRRLPAMLGNFLMVIYQGEFLGRKFVPFCVWLMGLGVLALGFTTFIHRRNSLMHRPTKSDTVSRYKLPTLIRKKIRLAMIISSTVFIASLYFATSALFVSVAIVAIAFTIPTWIIAEKLIQNWQHQKECQADFYEKEAESATILRAIPDSMLRMTQDGICLSYIPAKEVSSFVIKGDVINKHVSEFLVPEIALQLIKSAQLSLRTGSTHFYSFPIPLDRGGQKYHEARISAIGVTEVLIMIREIANFEPALIKSEQSKQSSQAKDDDLVCLLTKPELVQILELTLKNLKQDSQHHNHILCCLVVDNSEIDRKSEFDDSAESRDSHARDLLIHQVAVKMKSYLSSNYIARLDQNELVMLVLNCSLDQASTLVARLRHSLNDFSFPWQEHEYSINVSIGLLEINADSSNAVDLINVAQATCNLAKQKVDVKTFW